MHRAPLCAHPPCLQTNYKPRALLKRDLLRELGRPAWNTSLDAVLLLVAKDEVSSQQQASQYPMHATLRF
jgi:hypothetical protein